MDRQPAQLTDRKFHWHAYAWSGATHAPDRDRRNPELRIPALTNSDYLLKPKKFVVATYRLPDGEAEAYEWMRGELERHPRPATDFPPHVQLEYMADRLRRRTDVIWGYWSAAGPYISRVLIACPRDDKPCPYRRRPELADRSAAQGGQVHEISTYLAGRPRVPR